jgi:hypothetical protein
MHDIAVANGAAGTFARCPNLAGFTEHTTVGAAVPLATLSETHPGDTPAVTARKLVTVRSVALVNIDVRRWRTPVLRPTPLEVRTPLACAARARP